MVRQQQQQQVMVHVNKHFARETDRHARHATWLKSEMNRLSQKYTQRDRLTKKLAKNRAYCCKLTKKLNRTRDQTARLNVVLDNLDSHIDRRREDRKLSTDMKLEAFIKRRTDDDSFIL